MAATKTTTTTVRAGSIFFRNFFLSLLLLLFLYLGCFFFFFSESDADHKNKIKIKNKNKKKRRKLLPSTTGSRLFTAPTGAKLSSWAYIKRAFTAASRKVSVVSNPAAGHIVSPAGSTTPTGTLQLQVVDKFICAPPGPGPAPAPAPESDETPLGQGQYQYPLRLQLPLPLSLTRNEIFPCTACGEIFLKPHLLEQHLSMKHAVSELISGDDSGHDIVKIIFQTGWTTSKSKAKTAMRDNNVIVKIHRVLKIHNSQKILARFEEYRASVKTKTALALALAARSTGRRRDERCIVDGNELLRFHCSTFMCDLGRDGNSGTCNQPYCSVCGIIRSGFSHKLDGISTMSTSWGAHKAIPEETLEEFSFMNVKRAMLICRVIAGRVGCDDDPLQLLGGVDDDIIINEGTATATDHDEKMAMKADSVSVLGRRGGSPTGAGADGLDAVDEEEELLVFSPKALLPCFVVVYTTTTTGTTV